MNGFIYRTDLATNPTSSSKICKKNCEPDSTQKAQALCKKVMKNSLKTN